jgi:hypothetical protein
MRPRKALKQCAPNIKFVKILQPLGERLQLRVRVEERGGEFLGRRPLVRRNTVDGRPLQAAGTRQTQLCPADQRRLEPFGGRRVAVRRLGGAAAVVAAAAQVEVHLLEDFVGVGAVVEILLEELAAPVGKDLLGGGPAQQGDGDGAGFGAGEVVRPPVGVVPVGV